MRRVRLLAWLIAAICTAATVSAQVTTGSIVGTVSDTQGQVVPGATVAIKEIGKQTVTTVVTDANGSYTAPFLNPGTYEVEVELTGFKKYVRQGIVVQVNDRARVDASLEVGQLTEVTTVIAAAPLVRTESSEVGTVIEEKAIRELPLNQRNFASLVYLVPGVTPGQQGENLSGASTFNPRGASNFNALGQQANTNGWLVDGIDNNEFTFNTVIVAPSVESVREFKVLNGVFSAEFGRGAGVVSVSTKSGIERFPRHRVRLHPQRRVRCSQLLRAADPRRRLRSAEATPPPAPVRRRHRRAAQPAGLQGDEPHLLFRRLLRSKGDARAVVRQHRADRGAAQRRLQRLPQPDHRRVDRHLRPADDAAGPRQARGTSFAIRFRATSFRRTASTRSGVTSPASIRSRTSRATSTTT